MRCSANRTAVLSTGLVSWSALCTVAMLETQRRTVAGVLIRPHLVDEGGDRCGAGRKRRSDLFPTPCPEYLHVRSQSTFRVAAERAPGRLEVGVHGLFHPCCVSSFERVFQVLARL